MKKQEASFFMVPFYLASFVPWAKEELAKPLRQPSR